MNEQSNQRIVRFTLAFFIIMLIFSGIGITSGLDAKGWKYRSNNQNSGIYEDSGVRPEPVILWNYKTDNKVGSSPAVVNGVVYIGSNDGKLYALNAITGVKLWDFKTEGGLSSPAVVDGVVYVGSADRKVYAINAANGVKLWEFKTGNSVQSSPAVEKGVVYIGSNDGKVYALNARTGAQLWFFTTGTYAHTSPAVVNDVVYVGSWDHKVYALNAATGIKIWEYTTSNVVKSSPAVVDGIVYIGSHDNNIYALNAATGKELWKFRTGAWVQSCPAVVNGIVYVGSADGYVYAINAATGKELWKFKTGGWVQSSPGIAGGVVYIGSWDSRVYALDTATGMKIWDFKTGSSVDTSSPAIVNGVVYFGSDDGYIYALGSSLHANFTVSQTSGIAPLTVLFQDTSNGNPTGWIWDINGDGFRDYSYKSFEHTYTSPGCYSVTLTVTRNQEQDTIYRSNYIQVLSETPTSENFTLTMHPGWNFISTPKNLKEGHRTVEDVFNGIHTGGRSIYLYKARSQSWYQMKPQDEVECLQGIWVYSVFSTQISLIFNEDPSMSSIRVLSPGWNAIGFTHLDPVSAGEALHPVKNSWSQLIGFDGESQLYENSIINGAIGSHSDTNLVFPCKGYWLFMNGEGTLT